MVGVKPSGVPEGWERLAPPARLVDEAGVAVGVYVRCGSAADSVRAILAHATPEVALRTNGMPGCRLIFGALPRAPLRNDYCRFSAHTARYPELYGTARNVVEGVSASYRDALPELYGEHMQAAEGVLPHWRFAGTPFTTLNVNVNFAIPYHYDSGNQRAHPSNVLVVKRGTLGAELLLPQYRVALRMADGDLVVFQGGKVLHGVTPLRKIAPDAYRASVVAYTMQGMEKCLCAADELVRARRNRSEKEAVWRSPKH